MKFYDDKKLEKEFEWNIKDNKYYIDLGGVDFDTEVEWKKDIKLNPNNEHVLKVYFEHLFPRMKVHANFFDEHHSSRRPPCCGKVKKNSVT